MVDDAPASVNGPSPPQSHFYRRHRAFRFKKSRTKDKISLCLFFGESVTIATAVKKQSWKLIVSVIVVTLISGIVIWQKGISFDQVWAAVTRFSPACAATVLLLASAQVLCMILRVWCLFPSFNAPRLGTVAHGIAYGQLVNTFFPARAGDVLKALIISRGTKPSELPVMTVAGVIIADKAVDVFALLTVILLSGAHRVPGFHLPEIPFFFWPVLVVGLLLLIPVWKRANHQKFRSKMQWVGKFKTGFGGLGQPRWLIAAVVVGMGSWLCEAWALKTLSVYQGLDLSFDRVVFVLCVLNLAIAIPISLANLGAFEAAIVFALGTFGAAMTESIAIATVHHAMQLISILCWTFGVAVALAVRQKFFGKGDTLDAHASEFRVELEDKIKALEYFEKVSGKYDETVSKGILRIPRDRERGAVLKFAKLEPNLKLIDVGCGAGFYSLQGKQIGMWVHSVDASPGMVMRLLGKVDETEVADIEGLETIRLYDRVICAGVLDFVMNPEPAFMNLCRLVAPGGRMIILVPRRGLGGLFYRLEKRLFGISINLYTLDWFKRLGSAGGLQVTGYTCPLPTNMVVLLERPL